MKLKLGIFLLIASATAAAADSPYAFSGSMPESVLRQYLGRAVTHAGLLASSADPTTQTLDDDIRMLTRIGAKFIGRSAFVWDLPPDDNRHFAGARQSAARVHAADPEIMLQAAVFEVVTTHVRFINVPPWVFEEFGVPVETRNFNYEA
ncbi:MAG: hypothetical protein AAF492_16770, partial [Verrucomicrobiota bacterium]